MTVETEARARVVAEAMTWLGTPYVSCGDVRGAGVDCGMLLVRAFVDAGIVPPFDPRPYSEQWGQSGDRELYLEIVERFATQVAPYPERDPLPADIIVVKIGKLYVHGAIVTDWPNIIHSLNGQLVSRDCFVGSSWLRKPCKYYSVWP